MMCHRVYNCATYRQSVQVAAVAAVVNDCKRISSLHTNSELTAFPTESVSVNWAEQKSWRLASLQRCFVRTSSSAAPRRWLVGAAEPLLPR